MHNPKHESRQETNRAILASVKAEMDKPRMCESAREEQEESQTDHAAGVGIPSMLEWMLQMEKNNGKAKHGNS
jgi:hypothetical protein